VPEQVKGIARTGVLRLALEKGHSVVTSAVIDEAMDRFMPKSASNATKALAEAVALERARSGPVSMCRACGVTATQSGAVKCTVCGASDFEVISREMIERIAEVEGGLEEETTYDGRKLRWTEEARKGLWTMKNAYQRRRVKARVEKSARMKRLDTITLEFARQVIEDETGAPLDIPSASARSASARPAEGGAETVAAAAGEARLIARDDRKNPLISTFDWTDDAVQRIFRVPAGFMRNKTQERVEELAQERRAEALGEGGAIDLALVEDGIEAGKKMMAEMIATYSSSLPGGFAPPDPPSPSLAGAPSPRSAPAGRASGAPTHEDPHGDVDAGAAPPTDSASSNNGYLNEVRSLSAAPRQD
jgi:hypothetical protein